MKKGILLAFAANVMWGLLPVYWKALAHVPSLRTLAVRIVLSFVFLGAWMTARRGAWGSIAAKLRRRRTLVAALAASALIGVNWLAFLLAMNSERVVEASLGYFLYPLVTVVLGFAVLRERLRPAQAAATAIAGAGVLVMTVRYGAFPWLSVVLALSFAFYTLLKKVMALGSLESLTFETALLSAAAVPFLASVAARGPIAPAGPQPATAVLLLLTGVATAFPMVVFVAGTRLIPLAAAGFLNYVSSGLQFLLGAFVYREPFNAARWVGFAVIWAALAVFSADALAASRARSRTAPEVSA